MPLWMGIPDSFDKTCVKPALAPRGKRAQKGPKAPKVELCTEAVSDGLSMAYDIEHIKTMPAQLRHRLWADIEMSQIFPAGIYKGRYFDGWLNACKPPPEKCSPEGASAASVLVD